MVKNTTLEQIRETCESNSAAITLKKVILQGRPHTRDETPDESEAFFVHRDELIVDDGVVYKGSKVVIP